jgi:hypothetical protein
MVLSSSCSAPLKTKRYVNAGGKSADKNPVGVSSQSQLIDRELADLPASPASPEYTSTSTRSGARQDSAQFLERKRVLPLREQIELVQQEQAALHARIDSVRDELRELRSLRQSPQSRPVTGEDPI